MMRRIGALLGVLAVFTPAGLVAQARPLRPSPSTLFAPPPTAVRTDSVTIHPTYWKEGAFIGGGLGAAFGAWLGFEFCHYDRNEECTLSVLAGGVLFGLIGAVPGALIGGQFEKSE